MVNIRICISPSIITTIITALRGFPDGLHSKESTCNAGDLGSIPGVGRSLGGGDGNSNILAWRIPMDRGTWRATVHKVTESDTTEQLSTQHREHLFHPRTDMIKDRKGKELMEAEEI